MAAGMGSRFGGLKQMEPVGPSGETLLDYSIFDALRAGFDRVVFLIRKDFEKDFRDRVGRRFEGRAAVEYAHQELAQLPSGFSVPQGRKKPWGTTHAVWCARHALNGPFGVVNADDFYGRDAFARLAAFLRQPRPSCPAPEFAMIGYRLDATLSEHGSVARGVCRTQEDGLLVSVDELTAIARTPEGIRNTKPGEPAPALTGAECVSMNCWGFGPALFPLLDSVLVEFLKAKGTDLKAEHYIPVAVNALVQAGRAHCRVLPTTAAWFGMTYREDHPKVREAIARLVAAGEYPAAL